MSNKKSAKMKSIIICLFYLQSFCLFFYACSGSYSTILSYKNPSLNSEIVNSVAIFPLRNALVQQNVYVNTDDLKELNQMFQTEFVNKNSKINILTPISSTEFLNKNDLVNSYETLMKDYENTSIPNTQILNSIGQELKVDAVIQGFLLEVIQLDGRVWNPSYQGETKITVKYVLFSTNTGELLWECTCNGEKIVSSLKKAPSISEMIDVIKEKIINELPTLTNN